MKKALGILSFLFLILLAIPIAQAQDTLTQTYTSADGTFSIMYPTGWNVNDSYLGAGFTQFSSGPSIAMNQAMETLKSGDMGVALFLTPNSFLEGMSITGDNIGALAANLGIRLGHPNSTAKDLTVGTYPAARVEMNSADKDGEIIGVDFGNGKQAIAVGITFKGEQANLDATMLAMLATATTGSASTTSQATTAPEATANTASPGTVTNATSVDMTAANAVELAANFIAPGGSYSIMYPAGWSVNTQTDFPRFTSPNAPKTSADPFVSGSTFVTLETSSVLGSRGVSGDNIHDYLTSFLNFIKSPASTIEDLTLGGHPAVRAAISTADFDREVIGVDFGSGTKILLLGSVFKGELANVDAIMLAMLASMQFGAVVPTPAATAVPTTTISLQPKMLWTDKTLSGFPVHGLAFSADDKSLVIASPVDSNPGTRDLSLVDAASGKELKNLSGLKGVPALAAISPDGSSVASSDGASLLVWDTASRSVEANIQMSSQYEVPKEIVYNPATGVLYYITQNDPEDTLWQLDLTSEKPEAIYTVTDRNDVLSGLAFSPDGSSALVGVQDYSHENGNATVYQIDLTSHNATKIFDQPNISQLALFYTTQGQPLMASTPSYGEGYGVQMWDITSNKVLYSLPEAKTKEGDPVATTVAAIDPTGTILATGSINVEAQVWDAKTGAPLVTLDRNQNQMINSEPYNFAFSSKGNMLAVVYGNAEVVLWSLDGSGAPATDTTGSTASPTEAPTTASGTNTTNSASTCTVAALNGANLRSGPGTTFDRAGALAAGTSQSVVGQANSSDGFVWWKLDSGSWVRSDLVQTAGDCTSVPTVSS